MSASRKTPRSRSSSAPAKARPSSEKRTGPKKAPARKLSKKAERALRSAGADAEALFNEIVSAVVATIGKRLDEIDRRLSALERAPRSFDLPAPPLHVGPPMGSPLAPGDPLVTFEIPPPGVTAGAPSILYRGSKEPG